jgi:hypothetical protein
MKVVRAGNLDAADRQRFVELTPKVDADLQRELEYEAMLFHSAVIRQSWRKQKRGASRGKK